MPAKLAGHHLVADREVMSLRTAGDWAPGHWTANAELEFRARAAFVHGDFRFMLECCGDLVDALEEAGASEGIDCK